MGEEILVEDSSRGIGGVLLGTAATDMISACTEHAPLKTGRVGTLTVVDRVVRASPIRGPSGIWLIAADVLLS
jgi:hypothetical protein